MGRFGEAIGWVVRLEPQLSERHQYSLRSGRQAGFVAVRPKAVESAVGSSPGSAAIWERSAESAGEPSSWFCSDSDANSGLCGRVIKFDPQRFGRRQLSLSVRAVCVTIGQVEEKSGAVETTGIAVRILLSLRQTNNPE